MTTIPGVRAWGRCALVYGVFLACALPFGVLTGLLRPGTAQVTMARMLGAGALVLVHPAFVEELVFRVLLLPRDPSSMRRGRLGLVAGASLALYVASHPVNAMLFTPDLLPVFASPAYLAIVALLGLACTTAYWISRSIWPSVVMHWVTVVAWLWLLGGQALLERTARACVC